MKLLALAFLFLISGTAFAQRSQVKFTAAHFGPGKYVSPDGKYVAQIVIGEAEAKSLTVFRRYGKQKTGAKAFGPIADVQGIAWLPYDSHRLVFAANSLYGKGMLSVWQESKKIVALRKTLPLDEEGYALKAVSKNGRIIEYTEFDGGERGATRRMTLPHR